MPADLVALLEDPDRLFALFRKLEAIRTATISAGGSARVLSRELQNMAKIEIPTSLANMFANPANIRNALGVLSAIENLTVTIGGASAPIRISDTNAVIDLGRGSPGVLPLDPDPGPDPNYDADAGTYIARVKADGGTIPDEAAVHQRIIEAKAAGFWSDLVLWFNGNCGYKETGGAVEKWYNMRQPTNPLDATQLVAEMRPTFVPSVAALSGKPALLFDPPGQDGHHLNLGDLSSYFPIAASLFVVSESAAGDNLFSLFRTNNVDSWWGGTALGNTSYPGLFRTDRINAAWTSSPNAGVNRWEATCDANQELWNCNGLRLYSGGAHTYSAGGATFQISDNYDRTGNDRTWRGHIAEVLLFKTALEGQTGTTGGAVSYTGVRAALAETLANRY